MPVDFSLLPPEQKLPDALPSKLLWTVVFFMLTLIGVFAVLLLWPKNEPTQTPWFWFSLTTYSAGSAAFVVSRRYSVYEGRCLDVRAWNEARKQYIQGVFENASKPLAVVHAAYCFTDDVKLNRAEAIAKRELVLKAQPAIAAHGTVEARWLTPAKLDRSKWVRGPDTIRQAQVLEWLFDQLLDKSVEALGSLPSDLPLTVRLRVAANALEVDIHAVWESRWRSRKLLPATVLFEPVDANLMRVDSWLDSGDALIKKRATLMVTVQLNEVLSKNPPEGSAEAGAAVLLVPKDLLMRHSLKPVAYLHRPMEGGEDKLIHSVTYALRWGKAEPKSVGRVWLTGLEVHSVAPLHAALAETGVTASRSDPLPELNVDRTVGHAGVAAGWLALACSAESAQQVGGQQLLVEQNGNDIVVAVVAPALPKVDFGRSKLA